jgi:hypothetical protein
LHYVTKLAIIRRLKFTDREVRIMFMGIMIDNSRIALERSALGGPRVPIPKGQYTVGGIKPSNLKADTLLISYRGKQMLNLLIDGKSAAEKPAVSWNAQITDSRADPTLKLLDKHIAKAGDILERMREFAKSAQDETLSDDDRLAIQMNIGMLQYELDCETEMMYSKYHSGVAKVVLHEGRYEDTDAYKMLERAAERLANGEKWDVAEVLTPYVRTSWFVDLEAEEIRNTFLDEFKWEVSDDPDAPTVGDVLKAKGRSVMDSEAAGVTVAELENDLSKLQRQRDKLVAFAENYGANPQGADTGDNGASKAIELLFAGTFDFLNTLSRDPVLYNIGPIKNQNAELYEGERAVEHIPKNMGETYDFSGKSYVFSDKSAVDEALAAAVVHSKLNSAWSLDIQISLNAETAANAGTKTVLRPDPDEIVIPDTIGRRVVATAITDQDPEFYRETPRVNAVYIDSDSRLSSINGFFEYGRSPDVVVYKKIPSVSSTISMEVKGYLV